jgi:hypothetical protein
VTYRLGALIAAGLVVIFFPVNQGYAQQAGGVSLIIANETENIIHFQLSRSVSSLSELKNRQNLPSGENNEFTCQNDKYCLISFIHRGQTKILRLRTEYKYVFRKLNGTITLLRIR